MNKNTTTIAIVAASFVAGILLAPKSGKETRREIREKVKRVRNYSEQTSGTLKEVASEEYNNVKKNADDLVSQATVAAQKAGTSTVNGIRDALGLARNNPLKTKGSSVKAGKKTK